MISPYSMWYDGILQPGYQKPSQDVTKEVTLSFDRTMSDVGNENEVYFETSVQNKLLHSYDKVNIETVQCGQGMIINKYGMVKSIILNSQGYPVNDNVYDFD